MLPFITIHVSYLIAATYGHVDWCVPYWDSCTSISATGRQLPEKVWFKLGMMPSALVAALLWWKLWHWLQTTAAYFPRLTLNAMLLCGFLAACFLIMYTAVLGEEGDTFQRIRRTGITLTFAFTFLGQLFCTRLLWLYSMSSTPSDIALWVRRLLGLLILLLATGITSVILDGILGEGYDAFEDAFEWTMALMLNGWFAGLALVLAKIRESP